MLRDHNGAYIVGACYFFPDISDQEAAEIRASLEAVDLARDLHVQRIHLELDSQGIVGMINSPKKNMSLVGPWIEELKTRLRGFLDSRVTWVRRTANMPAHKLAKLGVGDERCHVWLEVPPSCILDAVSDDIPSYD